MAQSNLSWTRYSPLEDETSILDPLALDYFAQVLGNIILPSFTTRTSRARYYSMVCYGIYISREYLEQLGEIYYEKDILDVFKLFEKFWASSVIEYYFSSRNGIYERDGRERGLRGKRGAITAYHNKIMSLANEYKFLTRQLELGGLGAYRTSMESLELIKQDLNLTNKGWNLAKTFGVNNSNDNIVLKAIKNKVIVKKVGRTTLNSFGYHTCLDGFTFNDFRHVEEKQLLKEYVLDDTQNYTSISFIYNNCIDNDPWEGIKRICNIEPTTDEQLRVIEAYKTIQNFEVLSIAIYQLWCNIIKLAEENIGRISISQCAIICKPRIDEIITSQLIYKLMTSAYYLNIAESLHGINLDGFISKFYNADAIDYSAFIIELIKYHGSIMDRRNSGAWMIIDGGDIIVLTGYNYPKRFEDILYLHNYKIPNIVDLIEDLGWKPDA